MSDKHVLVFFPHNPYPPRAGNEKRCVAMLKGLVDIGCAVTLVSTDLFPDNRWDRSSARELEDALGIKVRVHEAEGTDRAVSWFLKGMSYRLRMNVSMDSYAFTPPLMRRWMKGYIGQETPDVIFMNYATYDGLIDHSAFGGMLRVIDVHDLVTLNGRMRQRLRKYLPELRMATTVSAEILEEDFFGQDNLTASAEEFNTYDQYHYTITISPMEESLIERNTSSTKVKLIPMTHEIQDVQNSYSNDAILTMSANIFNIQGYYYFIKRVLPIIRKSLPGFSLKVTGQISDVVLSAENVTLTGFLPSLTEAYGAARLAICPLLGGTGQQVKIVEAMAHGLPVIATSYAAESSPINHGINGLIADDAQEFADCIIELWNNPKKCRQMGEAARATIAKYFSNEHLLHDLSSIIFSK